MFDRSVFYQVVQELRRSYLAIGKYGVQLTSAMTPLERNRVAISFDVSEGATATIMEINIVGNEVFDDGELLKRLMMLLCSRWSSTQTALISH